MVKVTFSSCRLSCPTPPVLRTAYQRVQGVDLPEHLPLRSAYDVLAEVVNKDCNAKLLQLVSRAAQFSSLEPFLQCVFGSYLSLVV